ncbi:type II toxin-antitoxin system RelE/ParE family toxin [bacterium]|nr:type II toxin-antitoxin system RelE/ParE family toxin [bacterium]MBU1958682.1 type II toxin-antitoxin system RelE/ParE family toxin [bacterium]
MKIFEVLVTEDSLNDLELSRAFYEKQAIELGNYFYDSLITDIESLHFYAGIHMKEYGAYKMLAKRFPYVVYYDISDYVATVIAVLDQRKDPITNYETVVSR